MNQDMQKLAADLEKIVQDFRKFTAPLAELFGIETTPEPEPEPTKPTAHAPEPEPLRARYLQGDLALARMELVRCGWILSAVEFPFMIQAWKENKDGLLDRSFTALYNISGCTLMFAKCYVMQEKKWRLSQGVSTVAALAAWLKKQQ